MAKMIAPGFEVFKQSYCEGEWGSDRWFTDADIEEYDWDNQAIVFNSEASKQIKEASKQKNYARFAVCLHGKLLYDAILIPIYSAMFIDRPVGYLQQWEDRQILFPRPRHYFLTFGEYGTIARPEVEKHFAALGKLRKPESEAAFQRLYQSLPSVRVISSELSATAVSVKLEVLPAKSGKFVWDGSLSLVRGNTRWDSGPRTKGNVDLSEKAIQITVNLSIPKAYHCAFAENPNFDPSAFLWHVYFSIKPEISKSDLQAIGVVERMKYENKISSLRQTAVEHIQANAKDARLWC